MSTLSLHGTERRTVRNLHTATLRASSRRWLFAVFGGSIMACGGGADAPIAVATVTITPTSAAVSIGATSQLAASALDATGGTITGRAVTWSTSNASIATVSTSGLVTGITAGSAVVGANIGGKTGNAVITVAPPSVATITITPTSPSVVETDTLRLGAVLKIADGSTVTGRAITWTSASPGTATVSDAGLVKGLVPGTSVITATSEGKTATVTVTVVVSPCNISRALPIASGVPINGALAPTDCAFGDGTFLDLYTFSLAATQTVDVTMKSIVKDFDSYLLIYRITATGLVKVGENDDEDPTGAILNSRLTGSLSAGDYIIVANAFVSTSTTFLPAFGAYTLTYTSPFAAINGAASMINPAPNFNPFVRLNGEQTAIIVRDLRRNK